MRNTPLRNPVEAAWLPPGARPLYESRPPVAEGSGRVGAGVGGRGRGPPGPWHYCAATARTPLLPLAGSAAVAAAAAPTRPASVPMRAGATVSRWTKERVA